MRSHLTSSLAKGPSRARPPMHGGSNLDRVSDRRGRAGLIPYAIAVILFSVLVTQGVPLHIALVSLFNWVALTIAYARSGRTILSPPLVLGLVLTAFGLFGYFSTLHLSSAGYMPPNLTAFDEEDRANALLAFLLASLFALIGSVVTNSSPFEGDAILQKLEGAADRLKGPSLAISIGIVVVTLNLGVRGFDQLISRNGYLISVELGGVLTYLQLPAAVLLGLAISTARWPARIGCLLILFVMEAFSLALSSRMMSLVILMAFIGIALGSGRRWRVPILTFGSGLALFLVPAPLYMRGRPRQGLIPNIEALAEVKFFSYDTYIATYANFISAFDIVALTSRETRNIPWSAFAQSLNPLPGTLGGGVSDGSSLRISSAVPFAGLGEIANQTIWLVPILFFAIGVIFGVTQSLVPKLIAGGRYVYVSVAPTGIALLMAILFAQYNLRTASRMIYAQIAITVIIACVVGQPKSRLATADSDSERQSPSAV